MKKQFIRGHNTKKINNLLVFVSLGILNFPAIAETCRVATTKCEVQHMIAEAQLSPQPGNPIPVSTVVTLVITAIPNFIPSQRTGATSYTGNISLTLMAYNATATSASISCANAAPSFIAYYGYSGNQITSSTNAILTPNPTSASIPPALTISAAGSGTTTSSTSAATAATTFTPTNLWGVNAFGAYSCTITSTDSAYSSSTILVPIDFAL